MHQNPLIAYINDFSIMTVLTLAAIPLLLLMSSPHHAATAAAGAIDADEAAAAVEVPH